MVHCNDPAFPAATHASERGFVKNQGSTRTEEAATPVWSLIGLDEYRVPRGPTSESVRRGLKRVWARLRERQTPEPVEPKANLRPVSEEVLNKMAPLPDWTDAVAALEEAWGAWAGGESHGNVRVAVGAVGSEVRQVVEAWAESREAPLVAPPSVDDVLSGGDRWLKQTMAIDAPLVVFPRLERCYLRCANGLDLIRRIAEWLAASRQRVVVCSDSWAWTYLSRAISLDSALPSAQTFGPMDDGGLEVWLRSTMHGSDEGELDCREWPRGRYVVCATAEAHEKRSQQPKKGARGVETDSGESDFLRNLASHARGQAGIAREIWRNNLRLAEEIKEEEAENGDGKKKVEEPGWSPDTLWVPAWSKVEHPSLPPGAGNPERFVLHALLLHGGLASETIPQVAPVSSSEAVRVLHRLKASGIASQSKDGWSVTLTGYPTARSELSSQGFLTDRI